MRRSIKIAFSTNNGDLLVNDHFGEGKYFDIYEIRNGNIVFIERRVNTSGEEEKHGDPIKAKKILEILKDVDIAIGYRMGPNILRIKKKLLPIVTRHRSISKNIELLKLNMEHLMKILELRDIIVILDENGRLRIIGEKL
jgi:predicted Fe-Mo cluster-binding NifX family protein